MNKRDSGSKTRHAKARARQVQRMLDASRKAEAVQEDREEEES